MEPSRRLEAIKEGKFLSLQSDISLTTRTGLHNAEERPFVIPHYDPQRSIATSRYSKEVALRGYAVSESSYASSLKDGDTTTTADPPEPTESRRKSLIPALRLFGRISATENSNDVTPTSLPPYASPPARPPRPTTLQRPYAVRSSRFSITPSLMGAGYNFPTQPIHRDMGMSTMITSEQPGQIAPMHIVKLPDEWTSEPESQTEGTMAWMQVFAGFFVIMDAQ